MPRTSIVTGPPRPDVAAVDCDQVRRPYRYVSAELDDDSAGLRKNHRVGGNLRIGCGLYLAGLQQSHNGRREIALRSTCQRRLNHHIHAARDGGGNVVAVRVDGSDTCIAALDAIDGPDERRRLGEVAVNRCDWFPASAARCGLIVTTPICCGAGTAPCDGGVTARDPPDPPPHALSHIESTQTSAIPARARSIIACRLMLRTSVVRPCSFVGEAKSASQSRWGDNSLSPRH